MKRKDIVFFDTETTGSDKMFDQIIQLSMIKVSHDSSQQLGKMKFLFKPTIPITQEAENVHGISNEMIQKIDHRFSDSVEEILEFIEGCDLGGHNVISFDIPILHRQIESCGYKLDMSNISVYDTCIMDRTVRNHKLKSVYEYWTQKLFKEEEAHEAEYDTKCCVEIHEYLTHEYEKQNPNWRDDQIVGVSEFYVENDEIYFSFGKFRGKKAKDNIGYVEWMLSSNFSSITKAFIKDRILV